MTLPTLFPTVSAPVGIASCFVKLAGYLLVDPEDVDLRAMHNLVEDCIAVHDYWYDRSDDHGVWQRGSYEEAVIKKALHIYPDLKPLWVTKIQAMEGSTS